jgi:hypothetical protein
LRPKIFDYLDVAEMRNILLFVGIVFVLYTCSKNQDSPKTASSYSYSASHNGPTAQFGNYPCTIDCSGHQAGYDWAELNGIDDEYDCTGNSISFIEGCRQYVDENN